MSHDHAGTDDAPPFDASLLNDNVRRFWKLTAAFGVEDDPRRFYLDELVSDRYALLHGLLILRDELQLAGDRAKYGDVASCGANFNIPSVMTTVAKTNCGDRVHQGEATSLYRSYVASRFATLSESGEYKLENFSPIGGGCDDGPVLASVTVHHNEDQQLLRRLYTGNRQSCCFSGFDIQTHVGRFDGNGLEDMPIYGVTAESVYRKERAACGAIIACLSHAPGVATSRIKTQLTAVHADNFRLLAEALASDAPIAGSGLWTPCGIRSVEVVAAVVLALRGMHVVADALCTQTAHSPREVSHLTASVTVNVAARESPIIYVGRQTVHGGVIESQGFGEDVAKYGGYMKALPSGRRVLVLTYDGLEGTAFQKEVVRGGAKAEAATEQPKGHVVAAQPSPKVPKEGHTDPVAET